jgi:hypothetical protein
MKYRFPNFQTADRCLQTAFAFCPLPLKEKPLTNDVARGDDMGFSYVLLFMQGNSAKVCFLANGHRYIVNGCILVTVAGIYKNRIST